jgi:hypothetical protein
MGGSAPLRRDTKPLTMPWRVACFRGQRCHMRHASPVLSGCRDLKIYCYFLVGSLERQLEGTGGRVQAGQELQGEFFSLRDAFFGEFFVAGVT